jgi:simple sugar transport system ATP-binding protein
MPAVWCFANSFLRRRRRPTRLAPALPRCISRPNSPAPPADALLLDRCVATDAPLFISRRSVRRAAAAIAAQAGFDLPLDRDFAEIGPADQQMVAIARALSRDAVLLILDEPTASLSAREAGRLFSVLERLRARGLAIVYISHRSGDIARLADRAVILRGGRIAADLTRPIDLAAALNAVKSYSKQRI